MLFGIGSNPLTRQQPVQPFPAPEPTRAQSAGRFATVVAAALIVAVVAPYALGNGSQSVSANNGSGYTYTLAKGPGMAAVRPCPDPYPETVGSVHYEGKNAGEYSAASGTATIYADAAAAEKAQNNSYNAVAVAPNLIVEGSVSSREVTITIPESATPDTTDRAKVLTIIPIAGELYVATSDPGAFETHRSDDNRTVTVVSNGIQNTVALDDHGNPAMNVYLDQDPAKPGIHPGEGGAMEVATDLKGPVIYTVAHGGNRGFAVTGTC